ncbi:hypothetical protein B0A49_00684 [Cryomyces minteri]|uniref:Uncharacterized protein n=1 Tax=Cryomyces minteri TaxID=331657 RepID=A0A4U0XTP4_9PEZI|nr:hypothetical protein B0A49_00684 [Cryomyces minteri]
MAEANPALVVSTMSSAGTLLRMLKKQTLPISVSNDVDSHVQQDQNRHRLGDDDICLDRDRNGDQGGDQNVDVDFDMNHKCYLTGNDSDKDHHFNPAWIHDN